MSSDDHQDLLHDRLDPTVLDAWRIEPLADDFAERVVGLAFEDQDQGEGRGEAAPKPPSGRRWLLAGLGVAAVAAGLALTVIGLRGEGAREIAKPSADAGWTAMSVSHADMVQIAGRAQLELSPGAELAWRVGEDGEIELRQDFGRVRYEVEPGGPFVVETPAGHVRVVGTVFTVEVMQMQQAYKRWSSVAAIASAGLATWVFVHHGEVEVASGDAKRTVGEDGEVLLTKDAPPQMLASAARVPRSKPRRERDEMARRIRQRLAARPRPNDDDERDRERDRDARAAHEGADRPYLAPEELPEFERDYIRDVIADQLVPVALDCHLEVLREDPEYSGRIVLNFAIIADEEIGGVVDEVELGDETDVDDARFLACMQSAMYETLFPPPEAGGEIRVSYAFDFEPG